MQPLYWTPKKIKELKEAGYKLHFDQSSLVKKSDQAISKEPATAVEFKRSPGPGLKQQATCHKPQASSTKLVKPQATSLKPRG